MTMIACNSYIKLLTYVAWDKTDPTVTRMEESVNHGRGGRGAAAFSPVGHARKISDERKNRGKSGEWVSLSITSHPRLGRPSKSKSELPCHAAVGIARAQNSCHTLATGRAILYETKNRNGKEPRPRMMQL
ncbi:hypothetical protein R1sor_000854 [Riccia sorocarpa]|uniref:Uncharacterized protein n=1 Tax=Riccia sorocarpa TaxID=122646 RepID=A0ABD3GUA7_9MARC